MKKNLVLRNNVILKYNKTCFSKITVINEMFCLLRLKINKCGLTCTDQKRNTTFCKYNKYELI